MESGAIMPNSINESDIAIISMSCRFPGANNPDEFWQNLRDGVESITFFTDDELLAAGIERATLNNPNYVKAGATISDIDKFDAFFFGFNAREAEIIDPQHRLFLECAWQAIESAGYNAENYTGAIGVYAGVGNNNYFIDNINPHFKHTDLASNYQTLIGNGKDFLPTRVSYKLNLTGPSVNINTACSTSLVVVHLAIQGLLNGECDMALAGGISLKLPQKTGYMYQEGMILSPDGHCRAFDAQAKGTTRGRGLGIVVLKRLVDAIADGDRIEAVIKGSAINNDGADKVGYTAPSVNGQVAVITEAQAIAEVNPETISYIEAHGTGTELGDPIEISALTQAFRTRTQKQKFCAIGTVKTNIGHTDAAAGVAGLIKTVLALKHKQIPPSLHFQQANPKIDLENSPFYVNTTLQDWQTDGIPRRAGVSSFGIGGTNAHMVVEESPPIKPSGKSRSYQLLLLSTKTSSTLDTATQNLSDYLKQNPDVNLADVAYTLQLGRGRFPYKRMLICQNPANAIAALDTNNPQQVFSQFTELNNSPVIFMFSGQGSQYVNMGRGLYETELVFREEVDRCCDLLQPLLNLDLRQFLYPPKDEQENATEQLKQTAITQPTLFVIEYALAKLLISWGIKPQAMIGHSIGEYVAACLSGVFSLQDGLTMLVHRGRLMQQLPSGAMLAIPLTESEIQPHLTTELSVAAINNPNQCIVSGTLEAINHLEQKLTQQAVTCRRLHTSHAFHSTMMEPILELFTEQVKHISLKIPQIPYISNVTGDWITAEQVTNPNYWSEHIRQTVRFSQGIAKLLIEPERVFLEVGPGRTLSTIISRHPDRQAKQIVLTSLRHPQESNSDVAFLLTTLGKLWLAGVHIDWSKFSADEHRHRLHLPTYPFERQSYWLDPPQPGDTKPLSSKLSKKPNIEDWFYVPSWKRSPIPIIEPSQSKKNQRSLLFLDKIGFGTKLAQRLEQEGQKIITVSIGSEFKQTRDRSYTINPHLPQDYELLCADLVALQQIPDTIIHLWTVTENQESDLEIDQLDRVQDLGFYSLLYLVQALNKENINSKLRLNVISNNLQEVTGEETLAPEKATLLGAVKVIPQEYLNISCSSIDLVVPESNSKQEEQLLEYLLREITSQETDLLVAYRGSYRWLQIFEAVKLKPPVEPKHRLRDRGVYLITGGLGGMGLTFAEYLAKTLQAKLILVGRSTFPAKQDWQQWLATHDNNDTTSIKIGKLQELEALGADVLVLSADVANLKQMQQVITQANSQFGQINGVIHAAGVIDDAGVIFRRNKEETEQILAPKVRGTLVIDHLLKGVELDFCILCSSIGSVLYNLKFGEVGYVAANEFLDAFANYQNHKNAPLTVTINWNDWQEVGMSVAAAKQRSNKPSLSQNKVIPYRDSLFSSEGIEVLKRVLNNDFPRILIATKDLKALREEDRKRKEIRTVDISNQEILSKNFHSRPALANDYIAPRNEIEKKLAQIWQEILGVQPIGVNDHFLDLGGDSLLAMILLSHIRQTFKVVLPLGTLFEAPTLGKISDRLEKILWARLTLNSSDDKRDGYEDFEL